MYFLADFRQFWLGFPVEIEMVHVVLPRDETKDMSPELSAAN